MNSLVGSLENEED